jgi:outer membrane protein OmpA-like peptidoglycan-associated protein
MVILSVLAMAVSAMVYQASQSVSRAEPKITDRVILTPSPNGSVGRVVVTSTAATRELSKAYEGLQVMDTGKVTTQQESAASVSAKFAALMDARPKPASNYVLYFETGTVTLTPSSLQVLKDALADVQTRPVPEILVIGHSDTKGNPVDIQSLSLRRAQTVVDQLTTSTKAYAVEVVGRGATDLLVPTGPNVDEPKNRRVELSVR